MGDVAYEVAELRAVVSALIARVAALEAALHPTTVVNPSATVVAPDQNAPYSTSS